MPIFSFFLFISLTKGEVPKMMYNNKVKECKNPDKEFLSEMDKVKVKGCWPTEKGCKVNMR